MGEQQQRAKLGSCFDHSEMHGGLDQGGSSGGAEKWLALVQALKIALRELAVGLDGEYQRAIEGSQVFDWGDQVY